MTTSPLLKAGAAAGALGSILAILWIGALGVAWVAKANTDHQKTETIEAKQEKFEELFAKIMQIKLQEDAKKAGETAAIRKLCLAGVLSADSIQCRSL